MPFDSPGTVFRRWFAEVWNGGQVDLLDQLIQPDAIAYALDEEGGNATGGRGFRAFHDRMRAIFAEMHFTVHHVLEDGDMAAGRWSVRVRLAGAPQGDELTIGGMTMFRVVEGRIAEGWNEWDRLTLDRALSGAG